MLQKIIKLCIAGLIFSVAGIFSSCEKKIGCDLPFEVSTRTNITFITKTSAYVGGYFINTNKPVVPEAGIFYSATNQVPSVSDSKLVLPVGNGIFLGTLSGLQPNTKYYIRAYIYLDKQLIYATGLIRSFTTLP